MSPSPSPMTAVSIPHPPPCLARAANGLPLTAAGGRWRANAHGGGRRRGHSRDMAEGDGTATDSVWHHLTPDPHFGPKHAMQIRLRQSRLRFPRSCVQRPRPARKQKHRSYWYCTKQLRAGGIHAFQVPIMSLYCRPGAARVGGARIGGLQFSTITAWEAPRARDRGGTQHTARLSHTIIL